MKKFEILAIGKTPRIMQTILRLINGKTRLNGSIAYTAEEALEQANKVKFDMVLLGAGLNEVEAEQLKTFFMVPVVQHYGGGSGLLYAEISGALGVNIID